MLCMLCVYSNVRGVKSWSLQSQPRRNPACCSRTLIQRTDVAQCFNIYAKNLITIITKLIPRMLQSLRYAFLKLGTISESLHDNGMHSAFQVSRTKAISAFSNLKRTGKISSGPGTFLCLDSRLLDSTSNSFESSSDLSLRIWNCWNSMWTAELPLDILGHTMEFLLFVIHKLSISVTHQFR